MGTSYVSITVSDSLRELEKELRKHSKYGDALAVAIDVIDAQEIGTRPDLQFVLRYYIVAAYLKGYDRGFYDKAKEISK